MGWEWLSRIVITQSHRQGRPSQGPRVGTASEARETAPPGEPGELASSCCGMSTALSRTTWGSRRGNGKHSRLPHRANPDMAAYLRIHLWLGSEACHATCSHVAPALVWTTGQRTLASGRGVRAEGLRGGAQGRVARPSYRQLYRLGKLSLRSDFPHAL